MFFVFYIIDSFLKGVGKLSHQFTPYVIRYKNREKKNQIIKLNSRKLHPRDNTLSTDKRDRKNYGKFNKCNSTVQAPLPQYSINFCASFSWHFTKISNYFYPLLLVVVVFLKS